VSAAEQRPRPRVVDPVGPDVRRPGARRLGALDADIAVQEDRVRAVLRAMTEAEQDDLRRYAGRSDVPLSALIASLAVDGLRRRLELERAAGVTS
jgi:hypothetical protein